MYLVLYIIYMGFILCVHLFISLHKYLFECCFHICKGKKYGWEKKQRYSLSISLCITKYSYQSK